MAIAEFRDDIHRSLFPKTPAELRLVDEQLSLSRSATWTNGFVIPIATILIALSSVSTVPLWRVAVWTVTVIAISTASDFNYRKLMRRADHSAADIVRRARSHARWSLLHTLGWCSMAIVLWVPGNSSHNALLLVIVTCTLAGWSSMGAYHLATAAAAMPVYLITLVAMPLISWNPTGAVISGLSAGFWL